MKAISLLLLLGACASHEPKPDPIRDALEARKEKYRQCYLESESFTRKVTGAMKVRVFVDSSGAIKETGILENDFKDPNFDACILGQLRQLKFQPNAKGETLEIKQPLRFHPGQP